MSIPAMDERGVASRDIAYRISTPQPGAEPDYPAFHADTLRFLGASAIPAALAYALKWQLEFNALTGRPGERKELADKLIRIWHFLKEMEEKSPRDADGALLVEDPLQVFARAKINTELVELPTGETILVTRSREEAPLPLWQPTLLPPDLPFDARKEFPARPVSVEEIPPFTDTNIRQWLLTSLLSGDIEPAPALPAPDTGPGEDGVVPEMFAINEVEDSFNPGEDDAEKAIADAAKKVDRAKWTAARLASFKGYTPTVNAAIARLATTTLGDIQRHTDVKFKTEYVDDPLIKYTEVILYHSVFSFALDKHGEPFDLRFSSERSGLIDYPILIDEPGETVQRDVPADDGGVYVSVQKYGFGMFKLSDAGIQKLLFGTVGAFTAYGYGARAHSGVHKALQSYIDSFNLYAYVAAVTVPGAYKREEITLGRIRDRIPEFVDVVTPYLVQEVIKRAKYKLENWEDFAAEVAIEVIKQLILDKVKDKVRDYLIKKIGKRIIPGINAVAAVYDLVAGGEERMHIRNIIACIYVALKSDSEEDAHIAGKTCAKVLADEFEDAVVDALIAKSKKGAKKLKRKDRETREADERTEKAEARNQKPPKEAAEADPEPQPEAASDGASGQLPPRDGRKPPVDTGDVAPPKDVTLKNDPKTKPPRPPTERERATQASWEEQQRQHSEKIRKKVEELKKQEAERQKATANGDPATTGNNGTQDKGTKKNARGTGDKSTTTNKGAATRKDQDTGANAPNSAASRGNRGASAGNTATRPGKVKQKPPAPKRPPPDPNVERGTLEKPRRMPDGPPPDPEPMQVKDPEAPEGTHDMRDRPNVRTSRATHEKILRANAEKEGGAFPLDHDAHHNALKRGGGEAGEESRDSLSQSSVSVDDAANATPARGLPRDPRAPHESSSQHWGLHRKEQLEVLRQELENVKGDPEATRDVLRKHGLDIWEGRSSEMPDFKLGPDPEPTPKKPRSPKKPKEPEEPEDPEEP